MAKKVKKKYSDDEIEMLEQLKETYSLMHTQGMVELRAKNMAFDELLSRVDMDVVQNAMYELKEFKIQDHKKAFNVAIKFIKEKGLYEEYKKYNPEVLITRC